MPRRPRALAAVAAGLLLAGCAEGTPVAVHGSDPHPPGARVCADLLPADEVTALLPAGAEAEVREEQQPQDRYPVLRCEVTAGGRTFAGSAYLFNMAGADLVQLPGQTPATAAGLEGRHVDGMADARDAWLVQPCRVEGVATPVPLLVRTRLFDDAGVAPGPDRRAELAALTVRLAEGVARAAGCDEPTPVIERVPEEPKTLEPLSTPDRSEICKITPPDSLGAAASGADRSRWAVRSTPDAGSMVRDCDLFLDGRRVLSFQIVYGWIAPWAERPGQRGALTQQLVVPGVPGPDPGESGRVIAAVDGRLDDGTGVAYRLTRYDGLDTPGHFMGVSVKDLFRAFVIGVTEPAGWDGYADIPADAVWTYR